MEEDHVRATFGATAGRGPGSEVTGNISCGRIIMEDGARFKGKIDMGKPVAIKEVNKEQAVVEAVRKEVAAKVSGQAAKSSVL